jgi:hypothetical protein
MFPSIQGCKTINEPNYEDISNLASTFVKSDSYRKLKSNFLKLKTGLEDGSIKLNPKISEYELTEQLKNIKEESDLDAILPKMSTNSSLVKGIILEISKTSQEIAKKYPNLDKISKIQLQQAIEEDLKNDISSPVARIMKCDCSDDYARAASDCLISSLTDAALAGFLLGISGVSFGVGLVAVVVITGVEVYQYTRCTTAALVTMGACFDSCMGQ